MAVTSRRKRTANDLALSVTINDKQIEQVKEVKLLGITVGQDLDSVDLCVRKQCKHISSASFLIRNAAKFVGPHIIRQLLKAYLWPHVIYCVTAWGPLCNVGHIARIDRLLVYAARLVYGHTTQSHTELILAMGWLPFKTLVQLELSCLVFKAVRGMAPSYLADVLMLHPNRGRTRHNAASTFVQPLRHSNYGQAAFSYAAPAAWNALPLHVRLLLDTATFAQFRGAALEHFKGSLK